MTTDARKRSLPPHVKKAVLVRLGQIASALMVGGVLTVGYFIARSELAYDEAKCPYHEHARTQLSSDVALVEQARSCLAESEERRWVVERTGQAAREIGRRRVNRARFESGRYRTEHKLLSTGRVRVDVYIEGTPEMRFEELAD